MDFSRYTEFNPIAGNNNNNSNNNDNIKDTAFVDNENINHITSLTPGLLDGYYTDAGVDGDVLGFHNIGHKSESPMTNSSPHYGVNSYSTNNMSLSKDASNSSKSSQLNDQPTEEELYQRRKAQNRAAQRAFRERKEGKLKELSGQLANAESAREKLEKQLEELKQKNLMLDLENKILQQQQDGQLIDENEKRIYLNAAEAKSILSFKFPSTGKRDFIEGTIDWTARGDADKSRIEAGKLGYSYENEDGEKVLTISAVWDYLVEFSKLNDNVVLNIPEIMMELRGQEKCHGFGPAYPLTAVNEIIVQHIHENDD